MTGFIDSIYNGSAVDGKGLRVVVFLSGCNLKCPFCHNPETLYLKGKEIEVQDLFKKIMRYKAYIGNGGVTLSGGEPFMQPKFCYELIKMLHNENINVLIETNGHIINYDLIMVADGFICDVKNQESDDLSIYDKFLTATENKNVMLTCVIVPNVNDGKINQLNQLKLRHKNVEKIKLLPFKKLCTEKYKNLKIPFEYNNYDECDEKLINKLKEGIK